MRPTHMITISIDDIKNTRKTHLEQSETNLYETSPVDPVVSHR